MGPKGTILGCFHDPASQSATNIWSLKVAPNSEFSRSASVRRGCETRGIGIECGIGPRRKQKRTGAHHGGRPLRKPKKRNAGKTPTSKNEIGEIFPTCGPWLCR